MKKPDKNRKNWKLYRIYYMAIKASMEWFFQKKKF